MIPATPVRVWDGATRLFHWLLLALLGFSWWSAETDRMDWHLISGIVLLGLIIFRLIWGLIGGSTARFGSFVRSPLRVISHLRSKNTVPKPGHNPIGGYSVVVMLLLLIIQVVTGLFATDIDQIESGPLSYLVDFDQSRTAAEIHELSFTLLQVVIGLHVIAVLFYLLVRKRNLITPMITGSDKQITSPVGALSTAPIWRLPVTVAISAALAWYTYKGFQI